MSDLTIGLLSALLATNQPQAVSNVIQQQTGVAVDIAADPAEKELRSVMMADDAAQDEVTEWLHTFDAQPQTNKTREAAIELNQRIRARFELVRTAYGRFLRSHPDSARGYLAYGSFLNDIGDEEGAHIQYENSKQLDPSDPAVWNNLANYYGEFSPVTKAFSYYEQAIKLKPDEPVYYRNFATTVFLFRKDAREYYHLDEQQVFDKALALYRQSMQLDPENFLFATDYANSYYGIKPLRTNDALVAWTNALNLAHTDDEREGVDIHLARVKIAAGLYSEASNHLASVTNYAFLDMKKRLYQSLLDHKNPSTNTTDTVEHAEPTLLEKVPPLDISHLHVSTNEPDLATNLLVAPLPLRPQKPQ